VNELRGEKVDIVPWREDTADFIAEALSPAKVRQVILDEEEMEAIVVVPDRELSLAIGKEGQNARLAARLSGYRIDIRSETEQAGGSSEEQDGEPEEKPAEATVDKDAAAEAAPDVPAAESTEDVATTEAPEPEAAEEPADDLEESETADDVAATEVPESEAAEESEDDPAELDVVAEDAVVDDSTPGEQPEADVTQEDPPAEA
jgi:N utilization substance protein A